MRFGPLAFAGLCVVIAVVLVRCTAQWMGGLG